MSWPKYPYHGASLDGECSCRVKGNTQDLGPERLDNRLGALDPCRREQDRQIDTGRAKGGELLGAAGRRSQEAHGIQQAVAQRRGSDPLLHLGGLFCKAAGPEEPLEEREGGEESKILAGRVVQRL